MKYEMIFGDEALFDGASEDSVIAIKRPFIRGVRSEKIYFFSTTFDAVMVAGSSFNFNNVILKTSEYAERRIIKEPKRWTWEDKKAGRLPEVGCKCVWVNLSGTESPDDLLYPEVGEEIEIVANTKTYDGKYQVSVFKWLHDDGETQCYAASGHVEDFKPIETPAEKAQRLREEWKNNVIEIHHGKRRKMSTSTFLLDDIYDALLSGELPMPKKEDE